MINVSPSAWGLVPWFIVKLNVLVKLVDVDIGVFMNALDASALVPWVRLRSLGVAAAALPFNCRVVISMFAELAGDTVRGSVAPTPSANADTVVRMRTYFAALNFELGTAFIGISSIGSPPVRRLRLRSNVRAPSHLIR